MSALPEIVRLNIKLDDVRPTVTRIDVPIDISLDFLHEIIQAVMPWGSRIHELGDSARARRELLSEVEARPMPSDERVDANEFVDILREAVGARNGWKRILQRCSPRPRQPAGSMSTAAKMKSTRGSPAMHLSVHNFRNDPMFQRIECIVAELLAKGNVVAPVDVLIGMGLLCPEHLNNWRRGRVPYLERVINCNLTRLSRLLRILRFHAHDLNLKPSATVYKRYGKGPKQLLRFSKTGDAGIEAAYATHFVWPGKRPFRAARTEAVTETADGGCSLMHSWGGSIARPGRFQRRTDSGSFQR